MNKFACADKIALSSSGSRLNARHAQTSSPLSLLERWRVGVIYTQQCNISSFCLILPCKHEIYLIFPRTEFAYQSRLSKLKFRVSLSTISLFSRSLYLHFKLHLVKLMTSHFKARLACKCAVADKAHGEREREDESALHSSQQQKSSNISTLLLVCKPQHHFSF